eukprot:g2363.t1
MHGLIAAGKSTLCRNILSESRLVDVVPKPEKGRSRRIHLWHVSYDRVVDALSKGVDEYDLEVWKGARQDIFRFVRETICRSKDPPGGRSSSSSSSSSSGSSSRNGVLKGISRRLLADGDTEDVVRDGDDHVIFLDDNMYYRSMRFAFQKLCRQECVAAAFAQIHVLVSADIAAKRNAARERPIPDDVMERLAALAEPPNPDANHWERHTLRVSSNSFDVVSDVWPALRRAWKDPPKPFASQEELAAMAAKAVEDRSKTMKNAVHSLDKMLRQRVGIAMRAMQLTSGAGVKKTKRAAFARRLNELRKSLMAGMRKTLAGDPERASIALKGYLEKFDRNSTWP